MGGFAPGVAFVTLEARPPPLLITGVSGGVTTFSAFSFDALNLRQAGQVAPAALCMAASVILSFAAKAFGAALAPGVPA